VALALVIFKLLTVYVDNILSSKVRATRSSMDYTDAHNQNKIVFLHICTPNLSKKRNTVAKL